MPCNETRENQTRAGECAGLRERSPSQACHWRRAGRRAGEWPPSHLKVSAVEPCRAATGDYVPGVVTSDAELLSSRLRLRRFARTDIACVMRLRGMDATEAARWLEHVGHGDPDPRYGYWAISQLNTHQIVGWAYLRNVPVPPGTIGLGYHIAPSYRRCGYAAEAATRLLDYAKDRCGLEAVTATTEPANEASMRLLLKLGFRETSRGEADGASFVAFRRDLA